MNKEFRELDREFKLLCRHEAGHCIAGELLGWGVVSVRANARTGEGVTSFAPRRVARHVDVIVSAAGHAAEFAYRGAVACPSPTDRAQVRRCLRRFHTRRRFGTADVEELETRLAWVFTAPALSELVDDVAAELAHHGRLTGEDVKAVCGYAVWDHRFKRRFARCCGELVSSFLWLCPSS